MEQKVILFFKFIVPIFILNISCSFCLPVDSIFAQKSTLENFDSLLLQTPENYSSTLLNHVFPKYDVLISKENYSVLYRKNSVFDFGYHSYSNLLETPIIFPDLDTGISLSKLKILLGTNKEQIVFLDHTQRITSNIKIGISYHSVVSLGFLSNSLAKYRGFSFFLSYNKKNYTGDLGYNYKKVSAQENGGISAGQNTDGITKNTFDLLNVQLTNDNWLSTISDIYFKQCIKLSQDSNSFVGKLGVKIFTNYKKEGWSYTGTADSGFYKNNFIDSNTTFDSAAVINVNNKCSLNYYNESKNGNYFGFLIGVSHDYLKIKQNDLSYFPDILTTFFELKYKIGQFFIRSGGEYNISGDINRKNRLYDAELKLPVGNNLFSSLIFLYSYSNVKPAFIFQKLRTNHFEWENTFNNIQNHEISAKLGVYKNNFLLYCNFESIQHEVYLNENQIPVQAEHAVNISTFGFEWNVLLIKKLNISGIVSSQKADQDFERLPLYKLYSRLSYCDTYFKNALKAEVGMGYLYTSSFYSKAYIPSIGQSYLQNDIKTDGSPYLHLFLNFTIGSAQMFLKLEHLNNGLFGGTSLNSPGYPAPPRTLKFGLIWTLRN